MPEIAFEEPPSHYRAAPTKRDGDWSLNRKNRYDQFILKIS
jgi:hypothetical protein